MQVNTYQSYSQTGFKAAYIVQGVNINKIKEASSKYYGHKCTDIIYRVTSALAENMQRKTLPQTIYPKVHYFFPDFTRYPFVQPARTAGLKYQQKIIILTAEDAQEYKNVRVMEKNMNLKNTESQNTLQRILKRTGKQKIIIYADENNEQLTITDIKKTAKNVRHDR